MMKICAACSQELPRENFSKKQWQAKQQRRCKQCIAENREVQLGLEPANDDDAPLMSSTADVANGEGALSCWSEKELFKAPPPRDECPICLLTLPLNGKEVIYQECCGKILCGGCFYEESTENNIRVLCPFCRTPEHNSDEEYIERFKKRAEGGDAEAIYHLGCFYYGGQCGLPRNRNKAIKLWLRAGELGCSEAYESLGYAYGNGDGVERDEKKAKYYYELAAMGGSVIARHNLGCVCILMDRAVKHWMISAAAGFDSSLKCIRECYLGGHATKDDFEKALRAHQASNDEMKSDQREAEIRRLQLQQKKRDEATTTD